MELTEFERVYADAAVAIAQSHVAALIASEMLADFPSRLPETMVTRMLTPLEQMTEFLRTVIERVDTLGGEAPGEWTGRFECEDLITALIIDLAGKAGTQGRFTRFTFDIDFAPLLFAQCLVTTLAHLDGFLSESLRAVCRVEPRLLRRGKQMTWERVLDAASWDALITLMTEEYVFEFGWKSVSDRLDHLRRELGISLETPADNLAALEDAYQVRHILVHNGGRVSQEFLTRTQRSDVALGHRFTVTADYTRRVSTLATQVSRDVFVGIARKFFRSPDSP